MASHRFDSIHRLVIRLTGRQTTHTQHSKRTHLDRRCVCRAEQEGQEPQDEEEGSGAGRRPAHRRRCCLGSCLPAVCTMGGMGGRVVGVRIDRGRQDHEIPLAARGVQRRVVVGYTGFFGYSPHPTRTHQTLAPIAPHTDTQACWRHPKKRSSRRPRLPPFPPSLQPPPPSCPAPPPPLLRSLAAAVLLLRRRRNALRIAAAAGAA